MAEERITAAQNLARIREVFAAVGRWQIRSAKRLRSHVHTPVLEGHSIVDLLSKDSIEIPEMDRAFAAVREVVAREYSSGRVSRVVRPIDRLSLPPAVREDNPIGEVGI